jgi:hypothetical protein
LFPEPPFASSSAISFPCIRRLITEKQWSFLCAQTLHAEDI